MDDALGLDLGCKVRIRVMVRVMRAGIRVRVRVEVRVRARVEVSVRVRVRPNVMEVIHSSALYGIFGKSHACRVRVRCRCRIRVRVNGHLKEIGMSIRIKGVSPSLSLSEQDRPLVHGRVERGCLHEGEGGGGELVEKKKCC